MKKLLYYMALLFVGAGAASADTPNAGDGLDPSKELYQYNHHVWQKSDGLPQNSVHAITQTRDGYLWLATDEGLARFDGVQFVKYNTRNTPQFVNNQVRSLCEAEDGTLWIGFVEGGIVSMKAGVFRRFEKEPAVLNATVWNILAGRSNTLWFCTTRGLLKFQPADSAHVLMTSKAGLPAASIWCVAEDTSGTLLVSTRYGISMMKGGRFVPYSSAINYPVRSLFRDSDGTIWFVADAKAVAHLNVDSTVTLYPLNETVKDAMPMTVFRDRRRTLWIGTSGGGLVRYAAGKFSAFTAEDGLSSTVVESVFEDREGNLWIGTTGGGLNRFTNTKFTTYLPSVGAAMVWSIYQDRTGTIWGGSESGALLRLEKGKFVSAFPATPLAIGAPMSILLDRTNVLWVGARSGLYRIHRWRTKALAPSDYKLFDVGQVSAITEDSKGTIWVGSEKGGLFSYRNGTMEKFTPPNGMSNYDVRGIHEDRRGDLWLCTAARGVLRLKDGKVAPADSSKEISSSHVMCMHEDAEGMLWFGTLNRGLIRWDGTKFSRLTYAQHLFDESIFSIQEDELGNLWMSSNNGVFRASKKELNAAADGAIPSITFVAYGMSDGMRSDECNGGYQNAGCTAADGTMWFPTTLGYVMVNPGSLPLNRIPPMVLIESFHADKKRINGTQDLEIDPGAGVLEFTYAGLSFMASDRVRYKVLLEGFDSEWKDVGARRYVSYTNIPPGRYRFRVIAANNDGIWNETGAVLSFTLRPHFYQTYLFYFLVVVLIALSGAVAHKIYRRSKDRALIQSRRQAQLEARLKESQLNSLSMQLQPHFLFNTLNSISSLMHFDVDKADQMTAHLGDLLRMSLGRVKQQEVPLKQELEFLESYLCIEQARLDNRLCVVRHIDPETLPALVPSMLWQPLVENAIKHGIAPRKTPGVLTLGARRVGSELELTIQDNGEGMDRDVAPGASNGIGLRNTKERLELLYPHRHDIRIANNPEGGVTVTLRIPFRIDDYGTNERT